MSEGFKADQVGSFLRPARVKEARANLAAGRIDAGELARIEDEAILAVMEHQRASGIEFLSDGEFRRSGFQNDFLEAVDGYVRTDKPLPRVWQGPGGEPEAQGNQVAVGAKLHQRQRLTAQQTAFVKAHASGAPYKMTIPSPNQFPALGYLPGLTDQFYPTRSDLLKEITGILRAEVEALVAEGVPYIQVDAPRYSYFVDPKWREYLKSLGEDPDAMLAEAVASDAEVLAPAIRAAGVTSALHVCRGNNQSKWYAQGGYGPIAQQLFGIGVDRLLLEYDTDRAGTFEPLQHVPEGTVAVLGLISTKVGDLESKDDVLRRIDEAAKYVPLERLALSPQCGFASMAAGNLLSEDQQWAKLDLVVETARQVWT